MTLIEYCITIILLTFVMTIGLSTYLGFYNTLYIPSQYNLVGRALESTRNTSINLEQSTSFYLSSLDISSLLSIEGPESIMFSMSGTLEDSHSYTVRSGLYTGEISLNSNGIITY